MTARSSTLFYILLLKCLSYSIQISENNLILSRNFSLEALSYIFNENNDLIAKWKVDKPRPKDHQSIVNKIIVPYLLLSPSDFDFRYKESKDKLVLQNSSLNCENEEYSSVLTGNLDKSSKMIVDFIPFGYDLDLLEIRLSELYKIVDLFVVYESPRTQTGWLKPYLFKLSETRFEKFKHKILYLHSIEKHLKIYLKKKKKKDPWSVEKSMRIEIISRFKKVLERNMKVIHFGKDYEVDLSPPDDSENIPKSVVNILKRIASDIEMTYAIQSDADEFTTYNALKHFKYCQMKNKTQEVYFPSIVFKKNFYWVEKTKDLVSCFSSGNYLGKNVNIYRELSEYLWRPGPYLWPLSVMLQHNNTMRYSYGKECPPRHMGIGSAIHLSGNGDPGLFLMKKYGVVEQNPNKIFSPQLIQAALNKSISPSILSKEFVHTPLCQLNIMNINSLPSQETKDFLLSLIPITVSRNPDRYPFIYPQNKTFLDMWKLKDDFLYKSLCNK